VDSKASVFLMLNGQIARLTNQIKELDSEKQDYKELVRRLRCDGGEALRLSEQQNIEIEDLKHKLERINQSLTCELSIKSEIVAESPPSSSPTTPRQTLTHSIAVGTDSANEEAAFPSQLLQKTLNQSIAVGTDFAIEEAASPNQLSQISIVPVSSRPIVDYRESTSSNSSYYVRILDLIDTEELVKQVLVMHDRFQISNTKLAKKIGVSRSCLAQIIKHPQPWAVLTDTKRVAYVKLNSWYVENKDKETMSQSVCSMRKKRKINQVETN
jgi:predicted DNA-binding protein (UPF0251 family)